MRDRVRIAITVSLLFAAVVLIVVLVLVALFFVTSYSSSSDDRPYPKVAPPLRLGSVTVIHKSTNAERKPMVARLRQLFPQLTEFEAVYPERGTDRVAAGELGCSLSHIGVLRTATRPGWNLVFEDDAVPVNNPLPILAAVLARSKSPLVKLGHCTNLAQMIANQRVDDYVYTGTACCTHAYAVRHEFAAVLADRIDAEKHLKPCDFIIHNVGSMVMHRKFDPAYPLAQAQDAKGLIRSWGLFGQHPDVERTTV